jgi:hypothetical protein
MTVTLLMTLALLGPQEGLNQNAKITTCQQACDKVTDMTAGRWPKKRKGTEEQRKAFEQMRKDVHAQCMKDCESRGKPFIRCVRAARKVQRISKCYQKAGRKD